LRRPVEPGQYTSLTYTDRLDDLGIDPSVGSKGDAYDNAMAEAWVATLKNELVEGRRFPSFEHAEHEVLDWIGFYNDERLHEALGDIPPSECEAEHYRSNIKTDNKAMVSATQPSLQTDPGWISAASDLFVEPLERIVAPELAPVLLRKRREGEQIGARLLEQRRRFREALLELGDDPGVLLVHGGGVGLGEDRPHHRRHERLGALRDAREQVAHEVRPAALPGRARQRRSDRVDETGMRVRADQLDADEAARDQAADVGQPGGAVLADDDVETERLAEAVPVDTDGVHDAGVARAATLAALDQQRVERHLRVGRAFERACAFFCVSVGWLGVVGDAVSEVDA